MEVKRIAETLKEFEEIAAQEIARITPKLEGGATLVTLSGDLGAGKTAFVKAAARALGITEDVTSPTFTLQKEYQLPHGKNFTHLIHIDAYRLSDGSQLSPLHFSETLSEPSNLIMLEWPERVLAALPKTDIALYIETIDNESRLLTFSQ